MQHVGSSFMLNVISLKFIQVLHLTILKMLTIILRSFLNRSINIIKASCYDRNLIGSWVVGFYQNKICHHNKNELLFDKKKKK